ncbi:RNA polymerase sigma factor [Actinoplanes sp. TRM 88003]|uniref:RNA polymerase sigma factor n=1 Tax=Paractinoplanes aksuensis TaxID=2939490 RepID=A0ABT1DF11_9ACTN|nr:RNA polymerase sigma factor [Actinoplanes aksuensis]MCO8269405.1 RNA polymerase sigma factor [Actinoplanes aksuensis]
MKVTELDDEQLLRRVARADRAAFDELYRRTSPWLAVRLRRRCSDDGMVAEILQDTYLSVWRAAGTFTADGSGAGWLWTIASHRLVDAMRKRARHRETPSEELPVRSTPAAEDEALAGSIGDEVGVALSRLAPELREVLHAMVLDGLTVRETSILLGLPEGTVKSRARRARSVMREALS